MSRQAMEMALDCLLYYQSRETYPQATTPTSKTIEALRAALAEAEAPKAEPDGRIICSESYLRAVFRTKTAAENYASGFGSMRTIRPFRFIDDVEVPKPEFKFDVARGSVETRTWFELLPDGSLAGMGQSIYRDDAGRITKVVTEPTGVKIRYE